MEFPQGLGKWVKYIREFIVLSCIWVLYTQKAQRRTVFEILQFLIKPIC